MKMIKNLKAKGLAVAASALLVSGVANAHLVTLGWKDNGNGSVSIWGEHWHGDQYSTYSDNGGLHVYSDAGLTNELFNFQWQTVQNNYGTRADLLANDTLTGYADGFHGDYYNYTDWFVTDALALGNGTYWFFTGTNCCVDTMDHAVQITVTGVTSVPPVTSVSEPATFALMGLGLLGLGWSRSRKA